MLPGGADGRFLREDGVNINISILKVLKNLNVFTAIFQWYKLIEQTEIQNIFDTSCPVCIESPYIFPLTNLTGNLN